MTLEPNQTREDRLRQLRIDSLNNQLPGAAEFFGEKLVVKTESINDIYCLALAYYQQQHYERALDLLNKKMAVNKSVKCRYLAALCALALENGKDALDYLGAKNPFAERDMLNVKTMEGGIKLEAIMCYARGNAYFLLKDLENARDCYKEALTIDLRCYDALESLVKYNMLEEKAEWEFVMTLPYEKHCGVDADYFRYLYSLKLKKDILSANKSIADSKDLEESVDVKHSRAEALFAQSRYKECLKICKQIREQDRYFKDSIPTYIACLYELNMKTKLYEYTQELVYSFEDEAISWHAVATYHLYTKKNSDARQCFIKALNLNPLFFQAWIGFGHSFAAEKDHEQAINAYTECNKLMPGSHLPPMYIAMQYMEQGRLDDALVYLEKSRKKCDHDPYLENELAMYHYRNGDLDKTLETLHGALRLAKEQQCPQSNIWEHLWCNIGHVYRKQKQYSKALRCFKNALSKNHLNADARTAVGMIYQLSGRNARAISEYQLALKSTANYELTDSIEELMYKAVSSGTSEMVDTVHANIFDYSNIDINKSDVRDGDEVAEELNDSKWKDEAEDSVLSMNSSYIREEESHISTDGLVMDEGDLEGGRYQGWL
ncbi:TPR-like protein [Backusella circina FSU 941]|nr:TPR-like protein [Backusella circina FSU 941]